jgi:hypothetical protein
VGCKENDFSKKKSFIDWVALQKANKTNKKFFGMAFSILTWVKIIRNG